MGSVAAVYQAAQFAAVPRNADGGADCVEGVEIMFDLSKYPRLAALLKRRKPTTQTLFPPMREIPEAWSKERSERMAQSHLQEIEDDRRDLPF
jgi:hypothetical protein